MSKPVLLIRAHGNDEDSAELAKFGIVALIDPYLQLTVAEDTGPAFALLDLIESSLEPVWIIATSVNAIEYWAKLVGQERLRRYFSSRLNLNFAAVGKKTADALSKYGAKRVLVPQEANAATLAKELISKHHPGRALIPGGNLAMQNLPMDLVDFRWQVNSATVYLTRTVPREPKSAQRVRDLELSAILLRSPSAVEALIHFVPSPQIPLVCAGATTARAVQAQGLRVAAISAGPSPAEVAVAVRALLERQNNGHH
jgi:uroporphyrinogen-III synthase